MINSRVVVVALMVLALVPVDKVMSQASEDVTTCCVGGGCDAITEDACSDAGGTTLFGTSCAGLQACCSADGTCSMEGACDCAAGGGTSSLAVCSADMARRRSLEKCFFAS